MVLKGVRKNGMRRGRNVMSWMNRIVLVVLMGGLMGAGCRRKVTQGSVQPEKPVVYTTFYPTKYFAERIGGDLIDVICPVPADQDTILWMPDAKAIQEYQEADLVVVNGAEFAKWVQKVSLPENRVVNTAKPFADEFVMYEHATVHSHGKAGEHAHEGLDGHTWVDPVNGRLQANELRKALVKRFPEHEATFERGFAALAEDLDALDKTLKTYQASYKNQPLLVSHPAYNYIARRYGWNIRNLDLDPHEMPADLVFREIGEVLKAHPAEYLIWEACPDKEIADRMQRELGLTSIEFSPCELLSEDEVAEGMNYMSVMRDNLERIGVIFEQGTSEK